MPKFFTVVARIFATIFAIFFVITTILILLLTTISRQMFSANLYKRVLIDQKIYERLPEIIGVTLTSTTSINPCAQNPLVCSIDGASPEFQACLTNALGQDAYIAIGSGLRKPTEAENKLAKPCLDQYGSLPAGISFQSGKNPLPTASPALQACIKQAIGEQAYNELYNEQRQPTGSENLQMQPCFNQSGTGGQGGMPPIFQNLKVSDWEAIIKIIFPPAELQTMTESVIDQFFSYWNGKTDTVSLSLVKLKQRLSGQAGIDTIKQLLSAQPACTQEQLDQINGNSASEGDELILCNPSEKDLNKVLRQVQEQLATAVSQIPDEAIFIKPISPDTTPANSGPLGNDPASAIRLVRLILRLSPLLPLGFLLLVTLFGIRSIKSWMRWWGIPFFFAGTIALGLGIAAMPSLNWAWNTYVVVHIPQVIPTNAIDIGHEFVRYIVRSLTIQILVQAIILILIGLAAWIGSHFIKTKAEPQAPTQLPTPAP